MKILRFTSVVLAAVVMLPAAAQAQIENLHFDGVKYPGGDAVANAATGAYQAHETFPVPGSAFDIYCLDYDHTAMSDWTGHYVSLAQASVGGLYRTEALRQLGAEKVWGIAQLRAAAYLTVQFGSNPGSGANDDNWDDIHGAIWSMFSANASLAAYTGAAAAAVALVGNTTTYDGYLLILDQKVFGDSWTTQTVLNQAFITDDSGVRIQITETPEPSTYVLMGAGLLAVGFVRRRRRSV